MTAHVPLLHHAGVKQAAAWLALASLLPSYCFAQQLPVPAPHAEPTAIALPLPEDRGTAALEQSLKRLDTWASLMMIVAHPDDEDGAMLTYESRGQGVRTSLLTLTRGEGGQNAMSADSYDALGLIRTNELLRAGEYYGVKQYWGTEADFGFSKTQEESFARWGHDRVLYDAVLAVRRERPLILVSSFIGGITDGHGQHQVSGEICQEAYLAAGDPKVFPEQLSVLGLHPWTPRKVYARAPFAPVTEKGMFDYATGKWAPARFYNYVTKQWSTAVPSRDVGIPVWQYDPILGRSYIQIAREGWGEQRSQYGGANPTPSGGDDSRYHLYGSRVLDSKSPEPKSTEQNFFEGIPTGIEGLTSLLIGPAPDWLTSGLRQIAQQVSTAKSTYRPNQPEAIAPALKQGYLAAQTLRDKVKSSQFSETDKASLTSELETKLTQFQTALAQSLALDIQAVTSHGDSGRGSGPYGGAGSEETARCVSPGESIQVRIHTGIGSGKAKLARVGLESSDGKSWTRGASSEAKPSDSGNYADLTLSATVPSDAIPTEPSFSRPSIEQAYYDVPNPALRGLSFAPYPLAAWAEFDYDGLPIRISEVVQTLAREPGRGGVLQPLVVTPDIGLSVQPEARILPLDGNPLPVRVTVHTESKAQGKIRLTLPPGWTATPAEASFQRSQPGDTEPILFAVKPAQLFSPADKAFTIRAEAQSNGRTYTSGWQTIGYPGLRPYNLYRQAEMKTRAIDVKVAPGIRVGYVMGTGDTVPEAIEGLGVTPHLLTPSDVTYGDLSAYNVIFLGIRAYSVRPELAGAQSRLDAYVRSGGTLIVQYQSGNFPTPAPLIIGRTPERVVEESAPVRIIAPTDPLMTFPNRITSHDFDNWVEERGHSFLDSWDSAYTPLTETADAGQDPQRGGLIVIHPGKGTFVYMAYALYRQLPELVPGSYRLLANLLSVPSSPSPTTASTH